MSSFPIKIYIRTRPTTEFASKNISILDDHQSIEMSIDKVDPTNFLNTPESNYSFKFHSVLHNVSQEIVFEEVAREIIDSFIQGYNGCLFSFGQRGSGKTFTMFGGIRHFKYRGIIPRTLSYIFSELEKFKTIQFTLSLQFFQIYNDIIYDLLSNDTKQYQMAQDEDGNPYVQNLSSHQVTDVHEALQLLIAGDAKLSENEHKYQRAIHRGHSVFILDLIGRKNTRMTHSKLLLFDIAATEEANDSAFVNKSVSYLQQLIVSINNKDTAHLPFRRSKLTYLMRDAIGGNCRTAMIANVWPEEQNLRQTLSTFQFASEVAKVKNDSQVNTMEPLELKIEKLQAELRMLQAETELQAELNGAVKVDGLTQEDENTVADQVGLFLSDEIDQIPLPSAAHIRAVFAEIKKRYQDIPNQVMKEVQQNFVLSERVKNPKAPKDVGTIDSTGFSIGVAASQDRPFNIRSAAKSDRTAAGSGGRADNPPLPTTEQLFEIYKMRDGKAIATELITTKQETKTLVEKKKELIADINSTSDRIAELKGEIDKRGLRQKTEVFEDEADLLRDEIDAKAHYKESYSELQKTQGEIEGLKEKCAQIRANIVAQFEEWRKKWEANELYTEPIVPPHTESEQQQNQSANSKTRGKKPVANNTKKPPPKGRR